MRTEGAGAFCCESAGRSSLPTRPAIFGIITLFMVKCRPARLSNGRRWSIFYHFVAAGDVKDF
ncbi:hypothetical protein KCP73_18450 [Salmonella enterica subsp. enterica]|nr:hypothetical protein KCP73_18450 [Salmonella enterica subsp. enterica]